MPPFPYAIDIDAPLTEAQALMTEHAIRHLPVTQNGELNTKVSEAKAEDVIDHLDEGCSLRATSQLTKAAKAIVARLSK